MTKGEHMVEGLKAAPPAIVLGVDFMGFTLQEWLLLLTIVYTLLQIGLLVRKLLTARRVGDPDCSASCPTVRRLRDEESEE